MIDQALLQEIQYALVEPPDGGASWPSELWERSEVLDAVNSAQRALLRDTHAVVTRAEIAVLGGATSVDLPLDWIATCSAVWRESGVRYPLGPADAFEPDLIQPAWEAATGVPLVYLDVDSTTLTLRLMPTPTAAGTLELLYIASPTVLTGNGTATTIPDELADALKYGGMAILLGKVGRAHDPERALYCQERADLVSLATDLLLSGWA